MCFEKSVVVVKGLLEKEVGTVAFDFGGKIEKKNLSGAEKTNNHDGSHDKITLERVYKEIIL